MSRFSLEASLECAHGIFSGNHDIPPPSAQTPRNQEEVNRDERAKRYEDTVKSITKVGVRNLRKKVKELEDQAADAKQQGDLASAEELWVEATEIRGNLNALSDYRLLAKLWKTAPHWSEDESQIIFNKINSDQEWLPLLAFEKKLNQCTYFFLRFKAKSLIYFLSNLSRTEDAWAAKTLAETLMEGIRELNSLLDSNPSLFAQISKDYASWPMMVSHHPKFTDDSRRLLRNLGTGLKFFGDVHSKWDPNDLGTRIAMELLKHVDSERKQWKGCFEAADPLSPEKSASELGNDPFKAPQEWWKVAQSFLLASYPDIINQPLLRPLSSTARKKRPKRNDLGLIKKVDGRIRAEILDNIRQKFLRLLRIKKRVN